MDMTANINNLPIRFKVSAPASQFMPSTGITGATGGATTKRQANTTGMGLNVLLHGDGGQSFVDFPNQAVQQNLMGVVALAPNQMRFWGGGQGLNRTDGVSGGSLLLSGFFVPQFMTNYKTGVELNCGALTPQVDFQDAAATVPAMRMHFQSTQQELASLQPELPNAISAYEQLAVDAGMSTADINTQMTVNNDPNGGHCEFDGQDFVSGVQLMASNYAAVMQGGNGQVPGIGTVTKGIVGNENLKFSGKS
ncbi:MAG: hypothetical protein Q9227_002407 [Pyrenula ochraceoflavens]